jgi:GMP synthase-like glutamine amidotransferase
MIAEMLAARGARVEIRRMDLGEPLPAAGEIAGLVVMGGPMGALDDAQFPHLRAERTLLAEAVDRRSPVLAVCLGAQLLAAALGARVYTGPAPEIGLGVVEVTDAGRRDPVFGPAGHFLPVLHWHGDTFDLPAGATLLASSQRYPHQAYRVGSAYGLQFHLELGLRDLPVVEPHLPGYVRLDRRHLALVARAGNALFNRLFEQLVAELHTASSNELAGSMP